MKYYYIKESSPFDYEKFSSSKLGISQHNKDFRYDVDNFWDYDKNIMIDLYGEDQTKKLEFIKYQKAGLGYVYLMIPELHSIFSQFNMPEHRWYKAEAGYDLEFIKDMKKYFKIEYPDIDLKEKREYWIFQFLDLWLEELAFDQITFKLNDYDTFKPIEGLLLGKPIKDLAEYKEVRKKEIKENNRYPEPSQYIYRKNYDILWGGTHIVFNEKVKAALDASNLINYENGLEFAEFTEYEIMMLRE